MCICILKTKNGRVSDTRLKQAHRANPDGCGLLSVLKYPNNESHLIYRKGYYNWEKFYNRRNLFPYHDNLIYHFRTASSKGIGREYCHPHFVNKKLAFVQNGNFFHFSSAFLNNLKDGKTDCIRFNDEILKNLPDNFLENENILNALENYCKDQMSKIIFMDNVGKYYIINEGHGEWKKGCWYSNGGIENYQGYGYSGAYKYKPGDVRHKGGLPTIQFLSENRKKDWFRCDYCKGWFSLKNIFPYKTLKLCKSCDLLFELMEHIWRGK
jgi:hypothetical protein